VATSVIKQAASDLSGRYPLASAALQSDFYVDDYLSGTPDVTGALSLQQELCQLLSNVGLILRKWRSNSLELLPTYSREIEGDITQVHISRTH